MSVAKNFEIVSEKDYLASDLLSEEEHEFNAGTVYAMAGASNRHNRIVMKCSLALGGRLRAGGCEVFNSVTKVRVRLFTGTQFYYPDAMAVCNPNPESDSFQDSPEIVLEVISETTRRTDEGEKKDAYLVIPGLGVYLLVEQDVPRVVVHRRVENGFDREVFESLDVVIPLPEIGAGLPLAEIYEGLDFD